MTVKLCSPADLHGNINKLAIDIEFDLGQSPPAMTMLHLSHEQKPVIDVAQEKILSLADETKFAANGIVSRTLLRTANSRVVLFGFAEGQELSEHTSTQHAVFQISLIAKSCTTRPRSI